MVTLEDLPNKSIIDMSEDEGIELIRQIRLSRRTPKASTKKHKAKSAAATKKKKQPALTSAQAKRILELLEG